ncbi:MAG: PD-(D/E)XK nuclease family protein [Candidatus Nanohaloarchaea archaeon]
MRKASSIDKLYSKVKNYDTVVTADASLADALNRRLDRPVQGKFAATPKRLASENYETRREVFIRIVNETGLSYKQASYGLDKTLEAWKHTGEIDGVLKYRENDIFQETVDFLKNCDTSFNQLKSFRLEGDIAVINFYKFNELDKKILPESFDRFEMLEDEETGFEEFNIFESGLDIVKSLIQNIERVGAENSAVVVDPESKYQNLIESYLKAEEIDFTHQEKISENEELRAFLNILEIGESDRNLRVRDVKPVAEKLGLETGNENAFLEKTEGLEEFKEFMNVIEFMKVEEALKQFEKLSNNEYPEIRSLIKELNLEEAENSRQNINRIKYFLKDFDRMLNEETSGVLLADPKQATVVDRPIVFYIGMSSDWNQETPRDEWVKNQEFEEKKLKDFQILLQNGDQQVYMVEDKKMEEDVKPSFFFDEIIGENVSSFRELPHSFKSSKNSLKPKKFDKKNLETSDIEFLSQSGLNSLAQSPRLFYMSQLVSDSDEENLKKGRLFHDFAELYFNRPEIKKSIEEVRELFLEEMGEVVDEASLNRVKTEIDHGLENIMDFVDEKKVYSGRGYTKPEDNDNFFAEAFEIDLESASTEMYFKNRKKRIKGKVDLLEGERHVIDFKSGRKKSRKEVVKSSRVETFENQRFPNFQTLMYLMHHSDQVDGEIRFTYLYFLSDLGDSLGGKDAENATTVNYYPETFQEKTLTTEAFEYLIKDVKKSNDRRKTLEKLGYSKYRDFMREYQVPRVFDKDELLSSEFAEAFVDLCIESVGDYKYVKSGAESALRKLIEYRNTRLFSDDAERLEEFVDEKIEELESFEHKGYPVDAKASELPMEDLIVE